MKTTYTFSVVRYVHDVVSGEFVNVGVVLYAPDVKFVQAKCTRKFNRLSRLFIEVNGTHFRSLMSYIEERIESYARVLQQGLEFDKNPINVSQIISAYFAVDDSSIQFSSVGGGLTNDPERTLTDLFDRYVERYNPDRPRNNRDDQEVWSVYKKALKAKGVLSKLKPRVIVAPNFEYEFDHCWRNGELRAMEPASFDYDNPEKIYDKANRWLGRLLNLAESSEKIVVVFLIGRPQSSRLLNVYQKAQNILHKAPLRHDFIHEEDREQFAEYVKQQLEEHDEEHTT